MNITCIKFSIVFNIIFSTIFVGTINSILQCKYISANILLSKSQTSFWLSIFLDNYQPSWSGAFKVGFLLFSQRSVKQEGDNHYNTQRPIGISNYPHRVVRSPLNHPRIDILEVWRPTRPDFKLKALWASWLCPSRPLGSQAVWPTQVRPWKFDRFDTSGFLIAPLVSEKLPSGFFWQTEEEEYGILVFVSGHPKVT